MNVLFVYCYLGILTSLMHNVYKGHTFGEENNLVLLLTCDHFVKLCIKRVKVPCLYEEELKVFYRVVGDMYINPATSYDVRTTLLRRRFNILISSKF